MIEICNNNGKDNIILFVHGFTGGRETWCNESGRYFHEHLLQYPEVSANFDFAYFDYYTRLTNILPAVNAGVGLLRLLFKRSHKKVDLNVGISELSELLRTQIRFQLGNYKNIIIVAHSMGGLIAKNALLKEIISNGTPKVKMFISLAVPHLGADLATFAKLLSNNVQLKDLAPLSSFCPTLNDSWVKLPSRPTIKYFYGTFDTVVTKESAIGTDNIMQDIVVCNDDHLSIAKATDESAISVLAVKTYLLEFLNAALVPDGKSLIKLKHDNELNDEYFVLKLLLVDVHNSTIRHCKENFLNAEYARKLFKGDFDQDRLAELYGRIRTLYHDAYDKYVNSASPKITPGELVATIHEKIVSEDSGYLKSSLPVVHGLHKKGMLHQLANDLSGDIWWDEKQSQEALEKLKMAMEVPGGEDK